MGYGDDDLCWQYGIIYWVYLCSFQNCHLGEERNFFAVIKRKGLLSVAETTSRDHYLLHRGKSYAEHIFIHFNKTDVMITIPRKAENYKYPDFCPTVDFFYWFIL